MLCPAFTQVLGIRTQVLLFVQQASYHWVISPALPLLFFFFKSYLCYICEHTVAVLRHTRRGHQISLQMVVSHHVVAGT